MLLSILIVIISGLNAACQSNAVALLEILLNEYRCLLPCNAVDKIRLSVAIGILKPSVNRNRELAILNLIYGKLTFWILRESSD